MSTPVRFTGIRFIALLDLHDRVVRDGLGTLLIGRLSDHFTVRYGSESLRYAILSGTGFYLISAVLFVLAARHLAREWEQS